MNLFKMAIVKAYYLNFTNLIIIQFSINCLESFVNYSKSIFVSYLALLLASYTLNLSQKVTQNLRVLVDLSSSESIVYYLPHNLMQ